MLSLLEGSNPSLSAHVHDLKGKNLMDWTLEVVVVPVTDLDRAKAFYSEQLGFNVDHDTRVSDQVRVIQLTPPGSGCSVVMGHGIAEMAPGSLKGLQLVVSDIQAARAELVGARCGGERGPGARREMSRLERGGEALDNVGFLFFNDPDGNGWAVQQISARG